MISYYSFVGSYDGCVLVRGKWVRAVELNRIDKTGWHRVNGLPTAAMIRAMKSQPRLQARELFPEREIR